MRLHLGRGDSRHERDSDDVAVTADDWRMCHSGSNARYGGMRPRETRTTVLIPARIRAGGTWLDVRIRNVSSRGLMLEVRSPLERGTYLEIARTHLRIAGRVVWTESGRCGIQTRDDIDFVSLTDDSQGTPAAAELPMKVASPASARIRERGDRSRMLGRLMEFAAIIACLAGGAGTLSHVAYAQISGTFAVVQTKL